MKHSTIASVICAMMLTVAGGGSLLTFAQKPDAKEAAQQLPLTPRQPGGFIKEQLGIYLTIEGVLYDGNGKVESNSLVVDTVDGKKLEKPILILVRNVRLPAKTRCILKGYELGAMIGRPGAEYAAYKELGKDPQELRNRDAIGFQWRPYFVPLIAAEPKGLEVTTQWGMVSR